MWGAQSASGRSSIPGSFSFPMTTTHPNPGLHDLWPGLCQWTPVPSPLSPLPAQPSCKEQPHSTSQSQGLSQLLPKKQGPNSLSGYIKPS